MTNSIPNTDEIFCQHNHSFRSLKTDVAIMRTVLDIVTWAVLAVEAAAATLNFDSTKLFDQWVGLCASVHY